ncbi:unnamed protein product [Urochloa humidicola]
MDLETENRLLVEETRRLRLQDEKEGVQAFSPKPGVAQGTNSWFLSTTVDGIQQDNQNVEKDIEMDFKMKCRTNDHIGLRCKRQIITSRSLASFRKTEKDGQPRGTHYSVRHLHIISDSDSEDELEGYGYGIMCHVREKKLEMDFKMNCRNNDHTGKRNIISPVSKTKQDNRSWVTSSPVKYSHSVSSSNSEDELSDDEFEEFLHPRAKRGRDSYSDSEDESSDDELEKFLRPRVKRGRDSYSDSEDESSDDELEEFLCPRVNRGRGAVGSRMVESGPDRTAPSGRKDELPSPNIQVKRERGHRVWSLEKPIFFRPKSSDDDPSTPVHNYGEGTKNDRISITYDRPIKRSITYEPCRGERRRSITYEPCRGERRRSITYEPCRGERVRSITYEPCRGVRIIPW